MSCHRTIIRLSAVLAVVALAQGCGDGDSPTAERLAHREGGFLRRPHTTKLMWGSHRVIYVFADSTGELNLYYDLNDVTP